MLLGRWSSNQLTRRRNATGKSCRNIPGLFHLLYPALPSAPNSRCTCAGYKFASSKSQHHSPGNENGLDCWSTLLLSHSGRLDKLQCSTLLWNLLANHSHRYCVSSQVYSRNLCTTFFHSMWHHLDPAARACSWAPESEGHFQVEQVGTTGAGVVGAGVTGATGSGTAGAAFKQHASLLLPGRSRAAGLESSPTALQSNMAQFGWQHVDKSLPTLDEALAS